MGSKKLSKNGPGCGLKRRRSESRLFLGSPRCRENPKKIGSLNPQFHLHSSVPSTEWIEKIVQARVRFEATSFGIEAVPRQSPL